MKKFINWAMFMLVIVAVNISGSHVGAELTTILIRIDNPTPSTDAFFGQSAASIGDINEDGIGDLAIGAPGADKVYLFSGSDQSLIRILDDPDGLTGYDFGFAVVGVGDLDGDGVEDLAVGAPCAFTMIFPIPPPTPEWGRAFIFSGATGALMYEVHTGISFRGELDDYWQFGFAVAPLDDVTGDGIPDFAVSAPVITISNWGEVYAFSGADGSQIWVTGEPGFPNAKQPIPSFGYFMTGVEDVTGDGHKDLLVGAPYHDLDPDPNVYLLAGEGYVLSGADGSIFRTHANPSPVDEDVFGSGLAGIGDQNGDGVDDYAFGESGAASVHLFLGADGSSFGIIGSPSGGGDDSFGWSIAGVDDKNADGLDDFWVGAPKGGTVYLMNSLGDVIVQVDDPNPLPLGNVRGFGFAISAARDLDGNGSLDVIVGKPVEAVEGYDGAGAAFIILANQPPTADSNGPYSADCAGETTTGQLDGSGSSDPDPGDTLTFSWSSTCPGATFDDPASPTPLLTVTTSASSVCPLTCDVTLSVSDDNGASDMDTVSLTIEDTTPPVLSGVPGNATVQCDSVPPPAAVTATDNCDPSPTIDFSETRTDGTCPDNYTLTRTWTATDGCGNSTSAMQVITVVDTTPPIVSCRAPSTITPPDAPISFTATATDNCDSDPLVSIIRFDCFKFTKKGKRIDKTESCVVEVFGDTITILDTGGVGDNIIWTVQAVDNCGNVEEVTCEVEVVNPGRVK